MLWLVTTALAQDAVWTPALDFPGDVGGQGLVATDLDGDGVDDLLTTVARDDGNITFAARVGGATVLVELDFEAGRSVPSALDVDGDGAMELQFALPELDDGKVTIVDPTVLSTPVEDWEDEQLFFAEGNGSVDTQFGHSSLARDLDGDGTLELLYGDPLSGSVHLFSYVQGAEVRGNDATALWTGNTGWAIEAIDDRDGDGSPELVFATCNRADCSGAGLAVSSGTSPVGEIPLDPDALIGSFAAPAIALEAVRDLDGDGLGEVVWIDGNVLAVMNPEAGVLVERAASQGAALLQTGDATGDGLDDLWVSIGPDVVLYEDVLTGVEAQRFTVEGVTHLGRGLAAAGDVDGDGCEDVLATSDSTIYLLSSDCSATGDSGPSDSGLETDSGIETDSGSDSGIETDSGAGDSSTEADSGGDSSTDTDPPVLCVPEFGWGCPGSSAGVFLLAAGLMLIRSRE